MSKHDGSHDGSHIADEPATSHRAHQTGRHGGHGELRRYGQHASRRSIAMIAARRVRRRIIIAIAAITALIVAVAVAFGVASSTRVQLIGPGKAPNGFDQPAATVPSHTALDRQAAPGLDPGDIVIGVNGSSTTYVLKGESYVEGGAHAIEPKDGVLTERIAISGTVDTTTPGDYTVQYVVHDSTGHTAVATRTVTVVDTMDKQIDGVPVLMYHYVYDPATTPASEVDANWISTTSLEQQLQYLTQNAFYYPSWAEVRAFIDGTHSLPKHSIVLSFDDGEPHFFQHGPALMAKYRVPATSFIISSDGNVPQRMAQYATPYLEYESHSYDMHRAGGTVGHGGRISAMSHQEIVDDIKQSAQITGSLQAFAYPFGDTTPDAQAAVKDAGVPLAFTTEYGWAKIGGDPTALPRVRIQGTESLDAFIGAIQ